MGRSGKEKQTGAVNCLMGDYGFPENFEFTYWDKSDDYQPERVKPSEASKRMKTEPHPWLQFRDADKYERIGYLNRLAELQDFPVHPPRAIDWDLLHKLGVRDEFLEMMRTSAFGEGLRYLDIDMWSRIFKLVYPALHEWCLEFYSSLQVGELVRDKDITQRQLIHFRLGGKERHCTVLGFAYLTGMMEREELMTETGHNFLLRGHFDTSRFSDGVTFDQYWFRISGQPHHTASSSKASQIHSKKLQVLHKMITHSFLHRGDNNDKVYSDDLWLLRYFSEMGPRTYPLAPYMLARHMSRHRERRLLCGHFISKIVRRLGLRNRVENTKFLSNPVPMIVIGELDLVKSSLLTADKSRLLEDNEAPPPPARSRRRRIEPLEPQPEPDREPDQAPQQPPQFMDLTALTAQIQQLSQHQAFMIEQQRFFSSQQNRFGYTLDYYQPWWHR